MITIACPSCKKNMQIDGIEESTEWECPNCGCAFLVRGSANNPSFLITQNATQQSNAAIAPGEPPAMSSAAAGDPEIKDEMYVYALERLAKGQKSGDVRKQIIEAGYKPSQADRIVQSALRFQREQEAQAQQEASAYKAAGPRNMAIGGVICLIGIVVTVGTMAMASGGGSYILAWGAIVCGAIQFFRGLMQSTSA
jgi:cation transport ATPase/DNA-directed RNA polymerase subunit RPC12/RpoP